MTDPITIGIPAEGGKRRCGAGRSEGGLYLECGLGEHGRPLNEFLIDPPTPLPADMAATITKIGVTLLPGGEGRPHNVIDWVGTGHYPYATDFIEEGRVKGFSRKVSPALDFSLLGPGSLLIFAHERGRIGNYAAHAPQELPEFACPCGKGHVAGDDCLGLLYYHAPAEYWQDRTGGRDGYREVGSAGYRLPARGLLPAPEFQAALFAAVPLTNITLITDSAGQADPRKLAAASAGGFEVALAPE